MLKLHGSPQLLAHRPQWRLQLQGTTCPQCIQLHHVPQHQQQRQQKRYAGSQLSAQMLRAGNEMALQLRETGLWTNGRWVDQVAKMPKTNKRKPTIPKSKRKIALGDKSRVNIVSESLVNDIISYMGPKFVDRHKGCDIVDIYPGAGLWSSKLNEALQPRSHILMEPDAQLYEPFLKELTERPGVKLVPSSGIIWRNLTSILSKEHLPHQVELDPLPDAAEGTEAETQADETSRQPPRDSVLPRNDTLLVTANLAFFPRRRFGQFESVSQLVLFQFISSIRASSLFQKYGLVRMLIWVEDDDRHALVARSCQRRRRLALDGEMATDWVSEIAGRDGHKNAWFMRNHSLDLESCRRVMAKMQAEGIEIPKGRETKLVQEVRQKMADGVDFNGKTIGPKMTRPYLVELEELEARFAKVLADRAEGIRLKKMTEAEMLKEMEGATPSGVLVKKTERKTNLTAEERATQKEAKKKAKEEEAKAKKEAEKEAKKEATQRAKEEEAKAKKEAKEKAIEEKTQAKKRKVKKAEDDKVGEEMAGEVRAALETIKEEKTGEETTGQGTTGEETAKAGNPKAGKAKATKVKKDKAEVKIPETFDAKNDAYRRFKQLQFRRNREQRVWTLIDDLIKERDDMAEEHSRATTAKAKAKLRARANDWNTKIDEMNSQDRADFLLYRDNLHIFRQATQSPVQTVMHNGDIMTTEPFAKLQAAADQPLSAHAPQNSFKDTSRDASLPAMSWDRRDREPLTVSDEEFFPNAECALIDIQPKSMHPLLRAMGPGTSRAGDHFELIMRAMMAMAADPASKAIETVWPGSAQGVLQKCPSLYDVKQGGCPVGGTYGELSARTLNEKQWTEILEAWMAWPFRPTLGQLIQRISEEGYNIEEETLSRD
ncbi:ribosomal rna adenine methylase transferase [Ophiostoma piceae UAMH 11346]|uniref:rRNA adenine N(6)-methyltransferase n=1 Tax=Ophiostoma piceae (strain UAMH 11346) TaxID=1262450 RepID=S3BMZ2_OPHP1|nr:ribosomal rna adenine methylase transferase [Ophiostoma piceae UAMH 11346]